MYAHGFRFYFTPLPGFFSPFPHGTGSLSVDYEYLALEDGPPIFKQDFSCPALLFIRLVLSMSFRIRGYHPLSLVFPYYFAKTMSITYRLFRVRSPLLTESRLISFPLLTKMFQFSRFASYGLCIQPWIPLRVGFPIRIFPDRSLLPTPRNFSQANTSFFACNRQGIHHVHLFA